jgi:hypothetical protein
MFSAREVKRGGCGLIIVLIYGSRKNRISRSGSTRPRLKLVKIPIFFGVIHFSLTACRAGTKEGRGFHNSTYGLIPRFD